MPAQRAGTGEACVPPPVQEPGKAVADIRAFVAIPLDRHLLEPLMAVQSSCRAAEANVSWVRPENLHLTLKFLGNVHEGQLDKIVHTLSDIASETASFPISLCGVGVFPDAVRPRVIWAGIDKGDAELYALAEQVEQAMFDLGFLTEQRPFRAHLTIGRIKSAAKLPALLKLIDAHDTTPFGEMTVRDMRLNRSQLTPDGAVYTIIHQAHFADRLRTV